MINPKEFLSDKIFKKNIDMLPTREGYGNALTTLGEKNKDVVVLCADLASSTKVESFKERFPERFIEVGVAEQGMITIASGMANYGKIPFVNSFAIFSPGRNWEQIRTTIAINDVPVKIIGHYAGLSANFDGATHQMLEDIALMRSLPNMTVIVPSDSIEAQKATLEAAKNGKPTYIRLGRNPSPVFTTDESPFKIGRGEILWHADDPQVAIIASGHLVYEALKAAKSLSKSIDTIVLNLHTLKPADEIAIIRAAKTCGAVVTVEEHQTQGGLGGLVAEILSKNFPTPIEMVGVEDHFGESGKEEDLLKKYGLQEENIIEKIKKVIARKNS